MAQNQDKTPPFLPSTKQIQQELSTATSLDDFFGKDGIFGIVRLLTSGQRSAKSMQYSRHDDTHHCHIIQRSPLSAGNHLARRLAVLSVFPQLPRRGRSAGGTRHRRDL